MHDRSFVINCDVCKSTFRTKNAYKKHYMNHTGERPFVCPYCKGCESVNQFIQVFHFDELQVMDFFVRKIVTFFM